MGIFLSNLECRPRRGGYFATPAGLGPVTASAAQSQVRSMTAAGGLFIKPAVNVHMAGGRSNLDGCLKALVRAACSEPAKSAPRRIFHNRTLDFSFFPYGAAVPKN